MDADSLGYLTRRPVEELLFPSDATIVKRVRAIHAKPHKVVLFCTGAGAGLPQLLWVTPPASATILDAQFSYHPRATDKLLGRKPEKYCERETALALATAAYARGQELLEGTDEADTPILGLGLTAAVRSEKIKRGEHRVHIAVKGSDVIRVVSVTFAKGHLSRIGEGRLCDLLALNLLLAHLEIPQVPMSPELHIDANPECSRTSDDQCVLGAELVGGAGNASVNSDLFERPVFWPDERRGTIDELHPDRHILYPGSFDPLHYGHEGIAQTVERATGRQAVFAITQKHPTKGLIAVDEMLRRAKQFAWRWPIVLTQDDALYIQKARKFPGFGFAIGADVMLGILDPKYYVEGITELRSVINAFEMLGTKFYVNSRMVDGELMTAERALEICEARKQHPQLETRNLLGTLFVPVTGRWDVSSSTIRARRTPQ